MKSFRNIVLGIVLSICAFSVIFYVSCSKTKSPCDGVSCQNGGTCNSGKCTCPPAYEGTLCDTLAIVKFQQVWIASDVRSSNGSLMSPYYCSMLQGATETDVIIDSNFSQRFFNKAINGTINGAKLSIASQSPNNDGATISGTATYNYANKSLTWNYILTNSQGISQSFTGTWTPQ